MQAHGVFSYEARGDVAVAGFQRLDDPEMINDRSCRPVVFAHRPPANGVHMLEKLPGG